MAFADDMKNIVIGTVVSIKDPTYSGRIKVRIPGYNDDIDVDNLPWVTYAGSSMFSGDGGGSISIPRVGSKVRVRFKKDDAASMEWTGVNRIDRSLAEELAADYEGSHTILYDSESDLSIMYQNSTGLRLYYKGSFIQISPDGTITVHYGNETSGTNIQLSEGKIDIQAPQQINITSGNTIKLEANNIIMNASQSIQMKGDSPGEIAVNGKTLYKLLMQLGRLIDVKIPASGGMGANCVTSAQSALYNQQIQYI